MNATQNYLWYFTLDDYNDIFAQLKSEPQFEISESSTEDNLIGMISTKKENQTILTTIPYDKGWKVFVDGEAVEAYEALDALMAFEIKGEGEHLLELRYAPAEYVIGIAISIFGIIAFIAICGADFILKKTLLRNKLRVYEKDYFVLDDFDGVINLTSTKPQGDDSLCDDTNSKDDLNEPKEDFSEGDIATDASDDSSTASQNDNPQ